jgi:carboxymethylenebutenolidase
MPHDQIVIPAADGDCTVHVLTPTDMGHDSGGRGPWPAVIIYMDALAIRPALIGVAQRLADVGYCVLLPDLFYRFGPYPVLVPKEVFKGDLFAVIGPMYATTGPELAARDSAAFLDWLAGRPDIARLPAGVVGFCMGGGMALATAGTYPDRIAAAASFHGGRLATDAPDSPHLYAPKIRAEVLVAGADNDDSYPPEMHERLIAAFEAAGVRHHSDIYAGAAHGWMQPDFPVYDQAAAERGWSAMLDLFARTLHSA